MSFRWFVFLVLAYLTCTYHPTFIVIISYHIISYHIISYHLDLLWRPPHP